MRLKSIIAAAGIMLLCTGCSQNTKDVSALENVEEVGKNKYTCTYEDCKYEFVTSLPEQTKDAPLIVMLHGYGDSAEGFRNGTGMDKKANPLGYALVYPSAGLGWNSGIAEEDKPDEEFLISLVQYLQDTYGLDSKHTYAVGFSNGAFMTHRLAMEASDTFEGCVSVCGMMPERIWNEREQAKPVSFFQITGENDSVVPKHSDGSADHKNDPAIEDVMDHYVQTGGMKLTEELTVGNMSRLSKYGKGKRQVWDLFVGKGSHGWYFRDVDTNEMILEFLETQQ